MLMGGNVLMCENSNCYCFWLGYCGWLYGVMVTGNSGVVVGCGNV